MRSGHLISIPFSVLEYRRDFFVFFQQLGHLHIKRGKEKGVKEFKNIFREALRFVPLIKKTGGEILKKTLPYDIRSGKIKGIHVMKNAMSERERRRILADYEEHVKEQLAQTEISLNDYLEVAAICYRRAFKAKAKKLSPLEMYKKWADGRDGGMLSIKDWDSKDDFRRWSESGMWAGSHPFEIVFSWHQHGIHLYPPYKEKPYYSLRVTNYAYAETFVNMARALIKERVSFEASELESVLDYLSGRTYFSVNSFGDISTSFFYVPSREYKKMYFKHIEWDEIKIPNWKKN
jgi:hypothetical protein